MHIDSFFLLHHSLSVSIMSASPHPQLLCPPHPSHTAPSPPLHSFAPSQWHTGGRTPVLLQLVMDRHVLSCGRSWAEPEHWHFQPLLAIARRTCVYQHACSHLHFYTQTICDTYTISHTYIHRRTYAYVDARAHTCPCVLPILFDASMIDADDVKW